MQLKLISYNIWHAKKWEILLPWLKQQQPDILCLQEVTSFHQNWGKDKTINVFETLKSELHMDGVLGKAWQLRDKYQSYQGCAILSKLPIIAHKNHFLSHQLMYGDEFDNDWSKEPRVLVEATINVGDNSVKLFTTHLSYHKYFADDEKKLQEAEKMMTILRKNEQSPFILTGDLNSAPQSSIIQNLAGQYQNATPLNQKSFARYRFEHEDFVVDDLKLLLDYCFIHGKIVCKNSHIPSIGGSDHLPLIVELEI